MGLNKVNSTLPWNPRLPLYLLLAYFLLIFPLARIVLREPGWLSQSGPHIFLAVVLFYLLLIKKFPAVNFGFSARYFGQHALIGAALGALILFSVPLLDGFIRLMGLDQTDLFAGAPLREAGENPPNGMFILWLVPVVLVPLIEQTFFTGFVIHTWLKKYNPVLVIYGSGLLLTLAHFDLSLGSFILGIASAFLFHLTGTVFASLIFHASCSLAGLLIMEFYPRLITLIGFLF